MYVFDTDVIVQGDVILTAQPQFRSVALRKVTKSDFSHVVLYVGDGSYIHADSLGVHSANIQRLLIESQGQAKCFRPLGVSSEVIEKICAFARSEVGKQYSVPEAVRSKIRRTGSRVDNSNRQFCSRLVAQAFKYGGVSLVPNPSYCYPEDIAQSARLVEVEGCIRGAAENEVEFARSENPLETQANATNFIFSEVRSLTGADVQTFEQLVQVVISHPKYDAAVAKIVMESGYLTLWQFEVSRNPWRYSKEAFEQAPIPDEDRLEVAARELHSAKKQLLQYEQMADFFMRHWSKYSLKYLALEVQLYTTMVELSRDRIAVAEGVLARG